MRTPTVSVPSAPAAVRAAIPSLQVACRPSGSSKCSTWGGDVRGLSPTAIRLRVPRPVQPGKLLNVRLHRQRHQEPITRQVLVVGFQYNNAGWTVIGMFTRPLSTEEWSGLVDAHDANESP